MYRSSKRRRLAPSSSFHSLRHSSKANTARSTPHPPQQPQASRETAFNFRDSSTSRQSRLDIRSEVSRSDRFEQFADDNLDQVIAAFDVKDSGKLGCSYFCAQEERLYLLGDMRSADRDLINTLTLQIKPTLVLTSARVDDICGWTGQDYKPDGSQSYLPFQVDIRPSQEFNYSDARNKLVALDVSSQDRRIQFLVPQDGVAVNDQLRMEDTGYTAHEGRLLHMSGSIDMDNKVTISCAGAILTHIQRRIIAGSVSSAEGEFTFRVDSIEMSSLHGTMSLSANTLLCLQILHSESQPNMPNQGSKKSEPSSKEGLSVYGIFKRFAYTPQGKIRLRQHFLRPSIDKDVIHRRHGFIEVFLKPGNLSPLEKLTKSLKHIKNLRSVMVNIRKGVTAGSGNIIGFKTTVWATLLAFAFYGIDIQHALKEVSGGDRLPLCKKALELLEAAQLYRIDVDETEEQGRTIVKPGVDKNLDELKDKYDGLGDLLKKVALEIATMIPDSLDVDVNVVYFPQLGFNIAIPVDNNGQATFNGSDDGWDMIFVTENRAYFKDFRMKEMDDCLGDIYALICEKEIEIVHLLAQKLLQFEKVLLEASDICGELDCLLAMVHAASLYNLVRPQMTDEAILDIKGGRHLLQEMTVSSYIPNDTLLVGGAAESSPMPIYLGTPQNTSDLPGLSDRPSMLLLTGPNFSGKSVYMKQVALILFLAQVGSFVPAENATLGIADKILTRINTPESVTKAQSTFMNDLQQISLDLKLATSRSLVIIDEFGKGTNKSDGIGLACGILEHLLRLEVSPRVIAATHFHEIFEHGLLESRPRLQLGFMEVQVCEDSEDVNDQITYLYNFRLGRSNKSYGTMCAAINGISPVIVARANDLALCAARNQNMGTACAKLSAAETKLLAEAETLARNFLEMDFSEDTEDTAVRDMLETLLKTPGSIIDDESQQEVSQ
ncbi:hypothetical protein ASPZODRAFT_59687 [Penicilliopsis zonata CBS 506.65]|uniref:DNA mismatch repair protein MSH5 n=1 Tax=Penicilliopsis zonata CBS 506.65 TaxID=1073090 RepID=A0A1L9SRA5_9EURO|nr:hypothetical protein ASPZODRAFT_59687 [Penicilliopsis zonata CBS 506.65]OJJ49749.1 hypothetical protein ASPZODRAFT_59687 [Penicilliopsis zonata CBS 506.65]